MDSTWKAALQHLLDEADVIVMDLADLSEKNRGVAFELCQLFEQLTKERLVFLINDSTDMEVLEGIMNEAWNHKSEHSPNAGIAGSGIRLIHTGVIPMRKEGESVYDWKKRFRQRIDEKHLVCLLYDAAQPQRRPAAPADAKTALSLNKVTVSFFSCNASTYSKGR